MLFITHTDGEIVERALRILQNVMSDIETVDKQMSGSFQPVLMKLITQVSEAGWQNVGARGHAVPMKPAKSQ